MLERYHPDFASDLIAPCGYFDDLSDRLGRRFRRQINTTLDTILERPESFARVYQEYRAAPVRHFPYVVIFESHQQTVYMLSVRHASSDRAGWFDRDRSQ